MSKSIPYNLQKYIQKIERNKLSFPIDISNPSFTDALEEYEIHDEETIDE
jgi:hypothetical protein